MMATTVRSSMIVIPRRRLRSTTLRKLFPSASNILGPLLSCVRIPAMQIQHGILATVSITSEFNQTQRSLQQRPSCIAFRIKPDSHREFHYDSDCPPDQHRVGPEGFRVELRGAPENRYLVRVGSNRRRQTETDGRLRDEEIQVRPTAVIRCCWASSRFR